MAKRGRPEILNEALAREICRLVEKMPDAQIPVTWENVITQVRKRFRLSVTRQMLSQKAWGKEGQKRKLIGEAFSEAKSVQRGSAADKGQRYRNSPRAILQQRIDELSAKVLALQEELEKTRAQQLDKLNVYLTTPHDLRKLLEEAER